MIDKNTILKTSLRSVGLLSVAAISYGIGGYVTSNRDQEEFSILHNQVDSLRKQEHQAKVVKRVSEQLEWMASQQKLISIKERDRAEKESRVADSERSKAEFEKGLAEKAQLTAIASADEAKKARKVAEQQSAIATENMIIAQDARAHADTLLYLSLANSLAQSSLALSENGNTNLSRLLAYASWHYCSTYGENAISMQNVYSALLRSSDSFREVSTSLKGDINRLRNSKGRITAVTDYGEFLCFDGGVRISQVLGHYDFRDFINLPNDIYLLLCSNGSLLVADTRKITTVLSAKDSPVQQVLSLSTALKTTKTSKQHKSSSLTRDDVWHKLIYADEGKTIIAQSDHSVVWINASDYSVTAVASVDDNITCIGLQDNRLHIFAKNGKHFISSSPGNLVQLDLTQINNQTSVSAYLFDSFRNWHILGMNNGNVCIVSKDGKILSRLSGHTAAITELKIGQKMLVSSSYDNTIRLWDIENINGLITSASVNFIKWPLTFDTDNNNKYIWIGTADGHIYKFCDFGMENASLTRSLLQREFTDNEWSYYVGKGVKKINFMK